MAGKFSRFNRKDLTATSGISAIANDYFFGASVIPVDATVYPSGISRTSLIGTVTASGASIVNGTAIPSGISLSSAISTVLTRGDANRALTGISSTSSN